MDFPIARAMDNRHTGIVVGAVRSENLMGAQNYGNYVCRVVDGTITDKIFVPCRSRFEPTTRNTLGKLGAWRNIPNLEGIALAIDQLDPEREGEIRS